MTNPFDDADANFRVVVNEVNQHSLWPEFADVPQGWVAVHGPAVKADCVQYVTEHWLDITPVRQESLAAS